jgi:hypothetical protein
MSARAMKRIILHVEDAAERVIGQIGAGEGNRTLVVSLGSFCSTIELHPPAGKPI